MKSRHDELQEQFLEFNRAHPDVWQLFCHFTFELIRAGHKNGSVSLVFERMRWETMVNTPRGDEFKLNNNYRAFYARAFHAALPEYDGFFRTRRQTSQDKRPVAQRPLRPSDFPLENVYEQRQ